MSEARPRAVCVCVRAFARCVRRQCGSRVLVCRCPVSVRACGDVLGVLDLPVMPVAQQLERSVQNLREFEWASAMPERIAAQSSECARAAPERAPSGVNAPA